MDSSDHGGLYRDCFSRWCSELQSDVLSLLVPAQPNDDRHWIPNPQATSSRQLAMLVFLGKIIGIAIRQKIYLTLKFPPLVWAKLVGSEVHDDMVEDLYKLQWLSTLRGYYLDPDTQCVMSAPGGEKVATSRTATLWRNFAVQSRGCPLGEETELVPGGCDVEVTFENRLQYIQKVG